MKDRLHLIPSIQKLTVLIEQSVQLPWTILLDARLQHQIGIAPDNIDRIELNAAHMLDERDDSISAF